MSVACPWCGHTETGDGYAPHDAMGAHYADCLKRARQCGCIHKGREVWTCDEHAAAYLRERTAWRIANYKAGRWTKNRGPVQPSLLEALT